MATRQASPSALSRRPSPTTAHTAAEAW